MPPLSPPIAETLLTGYENAAAGWYAALFPIALDIFYALVALEFVWLGIKIALSGGLSNETWSNLVFFVFGIGVCQVIIFNAGTWSADFINTFIYAGKQASNLPGIDPGSVMQQGISVARLLLLPLGIWGSLKSPLIAILSMFAALCVLIAFTIISALLLITLVEVQFVTSAGVLLLGFLGSRLTRGIAEKYFAYLVAVSVHLLMFYLVIGAGSVITELWLTKDIPNAGLNIDPYLNVICGAVLYGLVAARVPGKASALLSGGISVSFVEMSNMAAMAMSGAKTAAPVAAPIANAAMKMGMTAGQATRGAARMVGAAAHAAVLNRFRGGKP